MLVTDFGFVCIFIGFAHLTESGVLVISEYDDGPLVLDHTDEEIEEQVIQLQPTIQSQPIITNFTPKRTHNSKRTIIQFGRHIYHLEDIEDLRELRSKLKPNSISYDYVDLNELGRSSASKNDLIDYLKDLFIVSDTPPRFCSGRQCEGDLRKSSKKHKKYDDEDWEHKKMQVPLGHVKRFQIVDNRHHKTRNPKHGSEEYHEIKKTNKKKKKKKYSSESAESNNDGKKDKWKTKNSEETEMNESNEGDSASASFEKWKHHDDDSKSDEDYSKKKTKRKKTKHSDDTKRKTIAVEDTYFTQGNKIYHSSGKSKKKHDDFDKRRRLEHFLPKRYHWDPSEIHDLGYYWFNGPKGRYPDPRPL